MIESYLQFYNVNGFPCVTEFKIYLKYYSHWDMLSNFKNNLLPPLNNYFNKNPAFRDILSSIKDRFHQKHHFLVWNSSTIPKYFFSSG